MSAVMRYKEHFARLNQHRIYTREYEGEEPAIILMHGFPDNLHLYDRLVPYLSPPRRVVTFDFLVFRGVAQMLIAFVFILWNEV